MNLNPVKQVADVINGIIYIQLPKDFDAKRVELTIVPLDDTMELSSFQQFLLDSPEMSDEELQNIQDKRANLNQWK
jgi:hypothetical protein